MHLMEIKVTQLESECVTSLESDVIGNEKWRNRERYWKEKVKLLEPGTIKL